jgi:hypothetical protein
MKSKRLLLAFAFGLGLALALLTALSPSLETARAWPPPPTPGDTRSGPAFVKAGEPAVGTGGWCLQDDPCGSIQYAINESEPGNGDTIYVAGGTYTGTGTAIITVTKSVTIYGGWDGNPGTIVIDPDAYLTILDAENGRRVAYITGTVAPVLEGLTLQRGNAAGLGGDPVITNYDFGGAIYANNTSPVITNCRIVSSTAGFGAGLALYYGTPTVANSVVLSNTASQSATGALRGVGGGMFLYQSPATIVGNIVMNNVASGTQAFDGGGGLYIDGSAAVIRNNTIQGNYGSRDGGGLFLYQSDAVVRDNTIQGNNATSAPGGIGGAVLMVMGAPNFEANTILNNQAAMGSGLAMYGGGPFTLTNNIIAWNTAQGNNPAFIVTEYWPTPSISLPSQGILVHNTIVENQPGPRMVSIGSPGGVGTVLVLTNTIVGPPGGVWVDTSGVAILDTTLWFPGIPTITGTGTIVSSTNYYSVPFFVGPAFHIGPGSPGIDLGTNAGVSTDVDGEPRPNGPLPDIGADEFYCYAPTSVTIAGPTQGVTNTTYAFTATISPPTATLPTTYAWQASGQPLTSHVVLNRPTDTMAFSWTIAGAKVVTVTAVNCGGSIEDTHTIRISQWVIYLPLVLRNSP